MKIRTKLNILPQTKFINCRKNVSLKAIAELAARMNYFFDGRFTLTTRFLPKSFMYSIKSSYSRKGRQYNGNEISPLRSNEIKAASNADLANCDGGTAVISSNSSNLFARPSSILTPICRFFLSIFFFFIPPYAKRN